MKYRYIILLSILFIPGLMLSTFPIAAQESVSYNKERYALYPELLISRPDVPSPFTADDGTELILAVTKNDLYTLIPVTVENGEPLLYSKRIGFHFGKDDQLIVNSGDFPDLARTGLYSESLLDSKEMITGIPVHVITYTARPGAYSWAGFIAEDEDIISVLKGDNRLVGKLGLTHPELAEPLFHIWNMILKEYEHKRPRRFGEGFRNICYNGKNIIYKAVGSKGWQISIFQDEIQGLFNIHIEYDLTPAEKNFLLDNYSDLSDIQMAELTKKLTQIDFSEMAPYYIQRYGFYEGHTGYRADPIAVSFIFGLKSLEEIEDIFKGTLHTALTDHFTTERISR